MLRRLWQAVSDGFQASKRSWVSVSDERAWNLYSEGGTSTSGEAVNSDTALRLATVFACQNLIAKSIAQLPIHLLEKSAKNERKHATQHPYYSLLYRRPNPQMTSYQFFQTMQSHVLMHGNAIAEMVMAKNGDVLELWPWDAGKVRIEEDGWTNTYKVQTKTGWRAIPADRVFHLRGLVVKGLRGLSPLDAARETIGEGIAQGKFSARFYKNSARPGGVIERTGTFLNQEAAEQFKTSWQRAQGGENMHKVAILEPGMTYKPMGITQENAQFLETRRFNQTEICAFFGVPPHMVGNLDRATFSNIEQQSLEYVLHCLLPWLRNWEQELMVALFPREDWERFEIKFNFDGLLRGDSASRWEAHWKAFQCGAKSPNEIRELEDLNPYEGGDDRFVPENMIPAKMANLKKLTESTPKTGRKLILPRIDDGNHRY